MLCLSPRWKIVKIVKLIQAYVISQIDQIDNREDHGNTCQNIGRRMDHQGAYQRSGSNGDHDTTHDRLNKISVPEKVAALRAVMPERKLIPRDVAEVDTSRKNVVRNDSGAKVTPSPRDEVKGVDTSQNSGRIKPVRYTRIVKETPVEMEQVLTTTTNVEDLISPANDVTLSKVPPD